MRKLETVIYIKDCPKLVEDKADSTLMIHSTCQGCEYYKGSSLYLITISCAYPEHKTGAEEEK